MSLSNLRVHPFSGADESIEITGEQHIVPLSGKPYIYLDELPVQSPSYPITLQASLPGSTFTVTSEADAFVNEGQPSVNQGSIALMETGVQGVSPFYKVRSFLRFDLSGLPTQAGSAYVWIFLRDTTGFAGFPGIRNIGIHHLTSSFGETSVTWASQPGHEAVAEAVTQISNSGWYSWNITALYNEWQAGTKSNNGLALKDGNEFESDTQRDWDTRERSAQQAPYLQVVDSTTGMTEVAAILPSTANQFVVNYERGAIALHSSLAGSQVLVNYRGRGSNLTAQLLQKTFGAS